MRGCSGEMRYWENHYDKVQAVLKLKEAETTFQNITLEGYLGCNCLLRFSLSGHSIIRSNSRWVKVSWNQGEFFRVGENPGSQSQDQTFGLSSQLLSRRQYWASPQQPVDIIPALRFHNPGGSGAITEASPDPWWTASECLWILSTLDKTSGSQGPAFTQLFRRHPQYCTDAILQAGG